MVAVSTFKAQQQELHITGLYFNLRLSMLTIKLMNIINKGVIIKRNHWHD